MPISYSAETFPAYFGLSATYPAWRAAIKPNQWGVMTTSNLSDVDPESDPLVNPNYPADAPWKADSGQFAVMRAWNGACSDGDNIYIPVCGGHTDYAGNESYKLDMTTDSPAWVRVNNPTGSIGNTGTLDDSQEATGLYFDGNPRPPHTYNRCIFVPNYGVVIAVQGNVYKSGQAGTRQLINLNPDTGAMTMGFENPYAYGSRGAACYDSSRNRVYWRGSNNGRMSWFDVGSETWFEGGASGESSDYISLTYIPSLDLVVWLDPSDATNKIKIFDPADNSYSYPSIGNATPPELSFDGQFQAVWVESLQALAMWNNSTSTENITLLSKGVDAKVNNWNFSTISVDPNNTVTPTAKQANGTYGRFGYSSQLNGFYLVNSTTTDTYFFSLGVQP